MDSHSEQNLSPDVFFTPKSPIKFVLSPVDKSQVNAILSVLSCNKASLDVPNHFLKLVSRSLSIKI